MLLKVADIALGAGVLLDVTFFTGHMSGPNWIPEWMLLKDLPMPSCAVQVISKGEIVDCAYRNPYVDAEVIEAECELLSAVVGALNGHPGVAMWNLGNEPDLVAIPTRDQALAWIQRMVSTIRAIDTNRPITLGMHAPSIGENVGFSVEHFLALDVNCIHGYPQYASQWARQPLDAMFVPFLTSMTSAFTGRATLAEEFGGCTQPPGVPSGVIEFTTYGGLLRKQFMASEEDFADYLEKVLENLVTAGSSGAMLWCFADYHESLWDQPPCRQSHHERFFGLVRPDGSLKPHALVIEKFASKQHRIRAPSFVPLARSASEYYIDPEKNSRREYAHFLEQMSK